MTISPDKVVPDRAFLLAHPAHFLALGFGSGLSPKAPGTAGTLAAFPLYWLLADHPFYWLWIGAFLLVGIWAGEVTGRDLGVHDHGGMVWDEIAAFLMVLPFAPVAALGAPLCFCARLRLVQAVRYLEAVSHWLAGCARTRWFRCDGWTMFSLLLTPSCVCWRWWHGCD